MFVYKYNKVNHTLLSNKLKFFVEYEQKAENSWRDFSHS